MPSLHEAKRRANAYSGGLHEAICVIRLLTTPSSIQAELLSNGSFHSKKAGLMLKHVSRWKEQGVAKVKYTNGVYLASLTLSPLPPKFASRIFSNTKCDEAV